ncbi:hypothetical protein BAUCODRAFT_25573 [Baudoinia panamericana UAMH 10762]|uniref:Uncharacterized protein n=1 Tax=Baudoinia panamericana (strain UAMH 10762) TaxID=717646 RepID=M2MS86_BAUPA|nr:uncharacterized protein BAUCODRAFT_25573 [Baudoinia panamericana UAMH 10762]EMC94368.1 hypothetical protein BAUCODRAFT_25573 [Baudoinia panamericana UAMH 10762]
MAKTRTSLTFSAHPSGHATLHNCLLVEAACHSSHLRTGVKLGCNPTWMEHESLPQHPESFTTSISQRESARDALALRHSTKVRVRVFSPLSCGVSYIYFVRAFTSQLSSTLLCFRLRPNPHTDLVEIKMSDIFDNPLPIPGYGGADAILSQAALCNSYVLGWEQTCALTKTGCPGPLCAACPGLIASSIRGCCSAATPVTCFQTALASAPAAAAPLTTSAPTTPDPNALSCQSALSTISSCEAAIANFDDLANSAEASCVCYDSSGRYNGNGFDGPWSACITYASTAYPSAYAFFQSNRGFCSSYAGGAVVSSGSSASASRVSGGGGTAVAASSSLTRASTGASPATSTAAATAAESGTGTGTGTGAGGSGTGAASSAGTAVVGITNGTRATTVPASSSAAAAAAGSTAASSATTSRPPGTSKMASVSSVLLTRSTYDPDIAAGWLMIG